MKTLKKIFEKLFPRTNKPAMKLAPVLVRR